MTDVWENFRKRQEITRVADNTKMIVVTILVISVGLFTLFEETFKPYIWHWAAFMLLLILICAIQDVVNKYKIKKAGL